jgi:hypothetical protein
MLQSLLAIALVTLLIVPPAEAATVTGTGVGLWLTCNKPIPPAVPGPLFPAPTCSPTPRVLTYTADAAADRLDILGATATGTSPFPSQSYVISTECIGDVSGDISCQNADTHFSLDITGLFQYKKNEGQFPLLVGLIVRAPAA